MNSIERVIAAIQGKPKDRLPISLTLSLYGAKLTGCPLKKYYSDSNEYVAGQQKVCEIIQPDILFSPFSLPLFGKAFGSELIYFENQPPNLRKPLVKKPNDINRINFMKALESPEVNYMIEATNKLNKTLSKDAVIASIIISPFDLPVMLMGLENWLDLVLSDLPSAINLMRKASEFFIEVTDRVFEAGASVAVLPSIFINPKIITKGIATTIIQEMKHTFKTVKGPIILHSGGAKMQPFLNIYDTLSNVAGFVINSNDELITVRNTLPNNQVIIGNIEGPDLEKISKEDIAKQVAEICNKFGSDPNFIFGSSGADIPFHTPLENILEIKNTIEKYYEK
jgi:uroporphyrinogen decarboxylase